jgi:flagellar biosynthesis regulator FlaF
MTGRPMPPPSSRVVLYERAGCHLCDEAAALMDQVLGAGRYDRIDIDRDDELVLRYGFRVPVVAVDDIDHLEAPMTAKELRALLISLGVAP